MHTIILLNKAKTGENTLQNIRASGTDLLLFLLKICQFLLCLSNDPHSLFHTLFNSLFPFEKKSECISSNITTFPSTSLGDLRLRPTLPLYSLPVTFPSLIDWRTLSTGENWCGWGCSSSLYSLLAEKATPLGVKEVLGEYEGLFSLSSFNSDSKRRHVKNLT